MPVGCETVCALKVAFAAPEQLLLLACCSPFASLLRCLFVTLGDLSAEIVEGRVGRRSSRARFFTRPFGLCTLLWHVCHSSSLRIEGWATGRMREQALRRWRLLPTLLARADAPAPRRHCSASSWVLLPSPGGGVGNDAAGTLGDAVYGESVAGSPPPDRSKRVIRSSISRSHLSRSTLPSQ